MSNEDILLTAKVGKLDSKEATDKLHKELNSIMGKLKVGYSQQDLDKMVSDLAKVAKKASVEMAVYVKNALTKSVQNVFSFDKKGNLTDTLPSNIWKEWSKTIKFTPKTFSPSGASKGFRNLWLNWHKSWVQLKLRLRRLERICQLLFRALSMSKAKMALGKLSGL